MSKTAPIDATNTTNATESQNKQTGYLSVEDYDYHLPDDLIARYPLASRSASRLLYVPVNQAMEDKQFAQLPDLLDAGDLLVFNDTKVMKARLFGQKISGGKVELLIEKILSATHGSKILNTIKDNVFTNGNLEHIALCYIKANKSPKVNSTLYLTENKIEVDVLGRHENLYIVRFYQPIIPLLDTYGEMPIPPYFNRRADATDNERYQTVFHDPAKQASVAAPTASLHFDEALLGALKHKGVESAFVTLHVGAGTFAPVKTGNVLEHTMHSEYAHLPKQTAEHINRVKARGNKVVAVGTTVTRVLETAYQKTVNEAGNLDAWSGDTDIFIYPGFEFGVIDKLITNFHLPKSTLLMLVSAFVGKDKIDQAYAHAIAEKYRFFSYGDAMLLERG